MFETFGSFNFMYERLKRPLKVVRQSREKKYDNLGKPVVAYEESIKVSEPLVTTTNNSVQYQSESGGVVKVAQTVWVTKLKNIRKLDQVTDLTTNATYKVVDSTEHMVSDLTYHTLKRVERGGDNNV